MSCEQEKKADISETGSKLEANSSKLANNYMKKLTIAFVCMIFFSGCFIFRKKEKYGCPSNGKNVGAEKIVSGDPKAIRDAKKAKKFRS